jgi:hypothetical protein
MPFLLPQIMMSLLAGVVAIAGLNLAFPVEIACSVTGVSFAALLANLPGTAGVTRGLPVLTICRIEWAIVRQVVLGVVRRCMAVTYRFGEGMTASRARMALAFSAVAAVISLPSVIRLLKWTAGAS